jgi:hypothetical protein
MLQTTATEEASVDPTAQLDPTVVAAGALDLEAAQKRQAADEASKEAELLRSLRQDYWWFKTERDSRYVPRWNTAYAKYRVQAPDERVSGEWRSKINKPYVFSNVEDALPHYMEGIFGGEQLFKLKSDVAQQEMLDAHERLLNYQLTDQIRFEEKFEEYLRQSLIYGTTFGFVGFKSVYRKKKMWTKQQSPIDPSMSVNVIQEFEVPDYVGNTFETVDVWDVYPHPRATRDVIKKVFWETWRPIGWIKELEGTKNVDKIQEGMASLPNYENRSEIKQFEFGSGNTSNSGSTEKVYKVTFCFDDENKKVYCYVAEQVLILPGVDYQYFHGECPLVVTVYTPLAKEFYGIGIPEQINTLVDIGNTLLNAKMDNLTMSVNQMFEVREGEIEDEKKELVFRPMGVVHSASGEAIRPIPFAMQTGDTRVEEAKIEEDIRRITGLGGTLAGQAVGSVSAGTGISLLQKAQLLRMEYTIRRAARSVQRIIEMMLENNMQFFPVPAIQAVLGPKMFANWGEYQPDNVTVMAKVHVEPAGIYKNDDVLRQQMNNLLNILGANPNFAQKVDWDVLLKQVLRLYTDTDPQSCLAKHGTFNMMEYAFALGENEEMKNGQMVPPAQPSDDEDIHMEVHENLAALRPDLAQGALGQHILSHNQAVMARQQMMLQAQLQTPGSGPTGQNGPGSMPQGASGGVGVNPNRQPSPAGAEGISRSQASQGRRGK